MELDRLSRKKAPLGVRLRSFQPELLIPFPAVAEGA